VAEMVLSRCVTKNDKTNSTGTGHRTPDHITYSFEFLDDFYTPYKGIKGFLKHVGLIKFTSDNRLEQPSDNHDLAMTPLRNNSEADTIDRRHSEQDQDNKGIWLQRHYNAENHVLNLMVSA